MKNLDKIIEKVKGLLYEAKYQEAVNLLERIPGQERTPEVYLFLGIGYRFLGRLLEAETYLGKALVSEDVKIRTYARWHLGAVEMERGNLEKSVEIFQSIDSAMSKTPQYPSFLIDLAHALYYLNRLDEAIFYLQKGLEFAKKLGDLHLIVTIISNIALLSDLKGDIRNALSMYQEAIKLSRRINVPSTLCTTMVNLAELYSELNDVENALKTVEEVKREKCVEMTSTRVPTLNGIAKVYLLIGKMKEAKTTLEMAERALREIDDDYGFITYQILSMFLSYKMYDLSDAKSRAEIVLNRWRAKDSEEFRIADFFRRYLSFLETGKKEVFEEFSLENPCSDVLVIAPLYIKFLVDAGSKNEAVKLFQQVCECLEQRGGKMGYFLLFRNEVKNIIRELRSELNEPEVLLRIAVALGDEDFSEEIFHEFDLVKFIDGLKNNLGFHPRLLLVLKGFIKRPDEKELYAKLAQGYRLRNRLVIKTFGRFELYIGNYELTSRDWKRPAVKDLLKYFIVNRNKMLPRDFIIENLWPEEDPDKSYGKFRVYISVLRDVIEPWLLKNEKSKILVYSEGKYGLMTDKIYLDAEEFERLIKEAERTGDVVEARMKLEKAIDLYAGDFLEDDLYLEFVYIERERLRNIFFRAVDRLKDIYIGNGEAGRAKVLLDKAFFVDPTNDAITRAYILLLKNLGESANARRIFEIHRETLKKRFDVEPSQGIAKLVMD